MFKIVEATFPNEIYDESVTGVDCDKLDSSGPELACLWREAARKLPKAETTESQAQQSLESLFKVCFFL